MEKPDHLTVDAVCFYNCLVTVVARAGYLDRTAIISALDWLKYSGIQPNSFELIKDAIFIIMNEENPEKGGN